ncbi:hypothetical protein [Ochrobactrum soli]|uniref:Uncharacterized protein n=1 Tax=Ochrobactrum soli TaxID=2448455 RepID=A0A849KLP3_9HYPH|nr:hypothetical protein [[Ochrobactrum] soli]NNU62755.1 hypothetical protein [[Ochrobactrum] soli]
MLQVITGKFFRDVALYETLHRGIFYSNYSMFRDDEVSTVVGRLLPSSAMGGLATFTYEIMEKLEAVNMDGSPSIMIATGGDTLANDFAAVISVALNITCTTDPDLTRRLIADKHPSLGTARVPSRYLRRMFDGRIQSVPGDIETLQRFVERLVELDRPAFEAAMRSIRQYVIAAHRLSDNPDLSYTLFVAALESLAQKQEPGSAKWDDYDATKRTRIENALDGAPDPVADAVRKAILENEHTALRRRFRAFVLEHLKPEFFRQEAEGIASPVVRSDLVHAIDRAYDIRSAYIHALKPMPRILDSMDERFESCETEHGEPVLTFNGLARLSRHIILSFIERQQPAPASDFNYREALPNIVTIRLASHYWIGNIAGFTHRTARKHLGALLQQLAAANMRESGAQITDLRPLLEKIEQDLPTLATVENRVPMLVIYAVWFLHMGAANQMPGAEALISKYESDLKQPTVDSLFLHVMTNNEPPWSLEQSELLLDSYYQKKHRKGGLQGGAFYEAAVNLWCAEQFRLSGDESKARGLIAIAVENYPSHEGLKEFERTTINAALPKIDWTIILLPRKDDAPSAPTPMTEV